MHAGELLRSSTSPAAAVALGASPASYTAQAPGVLYVAGGTVTTIAVTRGGSSTTTGLLSGSFSLRRGDGVTVTYAVIPTAVNFIPN
jgi:hypothetical protein